MIRRTGTFVDFHRTDVFIFDFVDCTAAAASAVSAQCTLHGKRLYLGNTVDRNRHTVFIHAPYRITAARAVTLFDDGHARIVARQVSDTEYLFFVQSFRRFDDFAQTGYFFCPPSHFGGTDGNLFQGLGLRGIMRRRFRVCCI